MMNGTGPAGPPGPTAPDALHGSDSSRSGTAALLELIAACEAGGAISRLAADAGISTTTTRAFLIARGVQLRHNIRRPPREERPRDGEEPRAKGEDTITVQIDPALEARIRERVAAGDARSVEDFMIQAVLLRFEVDRIPIDGKTTDDDPVDRYFDSPLGRERLRRVVQVALQTLPPGRKAVAEPGWGGSS